jgi:hypothetical protein
MTKRITIAALRDAYHRAVWDNAKAAATKNGATGPGGSLISADEEEVLSPLGKSVAASLRSAGATRVYDSSVGVEADRRSEPFWEILGRGDRFASKREVQALETVDAEAASLARACLEDIRARLTRFARQPTAESFAALPVVERMRVLFPAFRGNAAAGPTGRPLQKARDVKVSPDPVFSTEQRGRAASLQSTIPSGWRADWQGLSRQGETLAYALVLRNAQGRWQSTQVYDLGLRVLASF